MKVKILRIPDGLNDVGRDLQVGSQAPQVQGPSDATREQCPPKDAALGASGSSSSDPKVAPRAPVGFPKSFAPPQPDIKSDAKRVQIQDGDPRAQHVRGPVDVQAQMSSLTELVHQLSKLVEAEAQVGVSGASPPIASAQAPPPSVAAQHTTAVPTPRLTSASTSQVAQFPSSPLAPHLRRQAPTHPQNPVTRVIPLHAESVVARMMTGTRYSSSRCKWWGCCYKRIRSGLI